MNVIKKLQDPDLVVQFQKYFGVHNLNDENVSQHGMDIIPFQRKDEWVSTRKKLRGLEKIHSGGTSGDGLQNKKSTNNTLWSDMFFGDGTVGGGEGSVGDSTSNSTEIKPKTEKPTYVITNRYQVSDRARAAVASAVLEDYGIITTTTTKMNVIDRFWYYLFYLATKTGDEIFYTTLFPFWKWNVDGAVIRKTIYIWMVTMYIGQALKDILRVPRPPCPPVIRLDTKWVLEYGLPSTHAMVAFSIPFSILTLSLSRYQLNYAFCFVIALTWCILVCMSRIYLGMHSVLDIVSGLVLIGGLLSIILPLIEAWDRFMLTHPFSPLISVTLSIAMIVCYPTTDRWTPARGDTTVIVGVGCGCLVGSWLNYQLGIISEPAFRPPFAIIWPTVGMIGLSLLRTLLGLVLLIAVRAIFKSLSLTTICTLLQVSATDYKTQPSKISCRHRLVVELSYKFITYVSIGFTIMFTAPILFKSIGIERPTFYTEM